MELKKIDCKTSETQYPMFDFIRYDENTIISPADVNLRFIDISNPLEIKLIKSVQFDARLGPIKCFCDKKAYFVNGGSKIKIVDMPTIENITEQPPIICNAEIKKITASSNGRIFIISEDGDIGEVDATGTFLPLFTDIKLKARLFCDIKIHENLLIAADQNIGVLLFDVSSNELTLLCHVKFFDAITPVPIHFVLDNQFLFLMRINDIVMVDIRNPKEAKKLKLVKCPKDVSPDYLVKWENDYIVGGYFNQFEFYLLEVNESGLKIKEKIKLPGKQYGNDAKIFRKDNYLLLKNSDDIFEVFEIKQ
jgi:hypothetical protein